MILTNHQLLSLWYNALKIRLFEEKIIELYPEKEIRCPVHLSIGQEAVAAGTCLALRNQDIVVSNHRSHGHFIAKGGDIKSMLAEMYGKSTGCCGGRGGSMHLIDKSVNFLASTPIVGGTIPIAVGVAFSVQQQNKEEITTLFIGDGTTEEGVFHESLNFASLKKLPILFICENNLYSVYTPLSKRQPKREIYELAKANGIKSYQFNGNNALEVYGQVKKAIEVIKNDGGPIFLEFLTYRWREHCGVNYDNNIGYRTEEEFLQWKEKDPIKILRENILSSNLVIPEELEKVHKRITEEIIEAVDFAKKSPFPDKSTLFDNLYSK